jgi:hypothetical protein
VIAAGIDAGMVHAFELAALVVLFGFLVFTIHILKERE